MRRVLEFFLDVPLDHFPYRAERHFLDGELRCFASITQADCQLLVLKPKAMTFGERR
jgi:hypothetical protein